MAGLTVGGEREPAFGQGLLPVVVQSADDGEVLMLAWANAEAFELTLSSAKAHFWSRSRARLWRKGETSGNELEVVSVATDCDGDALLYRVRPHGPACHTGARSCFEAAGEDGRLALDRLERIIGQRASAPTAHSYTARLLAEAPRLPAAKLVEEAGETSVAALAESRERLVDEAADLLYHLLVVLRSRDVTLADVERQLAARHAR